MMLWKKGNKREATGLIGFIVSTHVQCTACTLLVRIATQLMVYWINSLMYWIHNSSPNPDPDPDSEFSPNTNSNPNPNLHPYPNPNPNLKYWFQYIKLLIQYTNLSIQYTANYFRLRIYRMNDLLRSASTYILCCLSWKRSSFSISHLSLCTRRSLRSRIWFHWQNSTRLHIICANIMHSQCFFRSHVPTQDNTTVSYFFDCYSSDNRRKHETS